MSVSSVSPVSDILGNVISWVNSVLNEAVDEAKEQTLDARISAVSMKLQIMSADLNEELEVSISLALSWRMKCTQGQT